MNHTREGVRGLIQALPAGIEASLQTTAPQPRFLVRPTTDKGALLAGVDLITPDTSAGRFVEGLIEAVARFDKERADKEKGTFFPVVVIVGSLTAEGSSIRDRDVQRLFQQLATRAVTVHAVMVGPSNQSGTTNVSNAIQIGINAVKQTGGRYESIAAHDTAHDAFAGNRHPDRPERPAPACAVPGHVRASGREVGTTGRRHRTVGQRRHDREADTRRTHAVTLY